MALNREEMRLYSEWIARMLGRLGKARKRLNERHEGGEIAELTERAYDALHALRVTTHYRSTGRDDASADAADAGAKKTGDHGAAGSSSV